MPSQEPRDKFLLIDANALVHRAFHGMPPLTSPKGELVNAVYGFLTIFFRAIGEIKPKYIAAAFDLPKPTFRHKEYEEYKAKRVKASPMLYEQIPKIKGILEVMEIPIFEKEGFEADDLIATICNKLETDHDLETIIVTGDMDALQLVDENTRVYTMRRSLSETIIYDSEAVEKRFGFGSSRMIDYKALRGDPSDNISGIAGIGEKTASELIKQYGTLENIYKNLENISPRTNKLLKNGQEIANKSKKLVTLDRQVPIKFNLEKCRLSDYDQDRVEKIFLEYGFKSLLKRLPVSSRLGSASTQADLFAINNEDQIKNVNSREIIELDRKLEPILREMEQTGIKIDLDYFKKLTLQATKEIKILEEKIFGAAGHKFNPSSPSQLAGVLYDELHLAENLAQNGQWRIKKKKSHHSTAHGELEKLIDVHPIISLILGYRQLAKLKNTYLEPLPKLVDGTGRLHTHFAQDTATGRLSSKNPNLQNIPTKSGWGEKIRAGFVADKGSYLVCFDYSQLELRLLAHIAGEKAMIAAFKAGEDIHDKTAKELNISERRIAKAVNFGINYGLSAFGLSEQLKIPREKSQAFIDAYFVAYPAVAGYVQKTIKEAQTRGYVESMFGRKRFLPEINSPDHRSSAAAERMAINMPIQGTAADIMKMAMVEIKSKIPGLAKRSGAGKNQKSKLLLQVHDELVFEIIDDSQLNKNVEKIKEIIENIVKLKVPLIVKVTYGRNWAKQENLDI